jgi:hypothetical protein
VSVGSCACRDDVMSCVVPVDQLRLEKMPKTKPMNAEEGPSL